MQMKEIGLEEMKALQMDILSAMQRFFTEHGMKYSLACGSMLGCARHKGYIPWDDDIDIYLLRKDYDRLVREFPDTYEGRYRLATLEREHSYCLLYGKAYDTRTILREPGQKMPDLGVNIDIFPVDNVPEYGEKWLKYDAKRRKWVELYSIRCDRKYKIFKYHSERTPMQNVYATVMKIALLFVPLRPFIKFVQRRIVKKYDKMETGYVFECVQGIFQKRPFRKSLFDDIVPMPFEDRTFMAFADYDEYLTNGFGDWRQLPPVEKRVTHHSFKAWWK